MGHRSSQQLSHLFTRQLQSFLKKAGNMKAFAICVMLVASFANSNAKAVNGQYAPVPVGPPNAALAVGPAKPYSYAYEVIDPAGGNAYGHRESSDGTVVEGEYRVVLPDTRAQIVTYTSSAETGYVAEVRYEGTPVFPAVAVAPKSERLVQPVQGVRPQQRQQGGRPANGRPIAKRNENSSASEFNDGPNVELKFFSET